MEKEFYYYQKIIKPIEKKYNRMNRLYNIFKLKYFKDKQVYYNKLLIKYYKTLKIDNKFFIELEKNI